MRTGVGRNRCDDCRRVFGGRKGFDEHRHSSGERSRCLTAAELRRRGFHRRHDRVWVRASMDDRRLHPQQLRLFHPGRPWRPENRPRARVLQEAQRLGLVVIPGKNAGPSGPATEPLAWGEAA